MRKKVRVAKKTNTRQRYNLDAIPASNMKMRHFRKKRSLERMKNTFFRFRSFIKFVSIILILWLCSRLMICKYWYLPKNIFDTYPNKNLHIIGNKITPDDKIIRIMRKYPIPQKPIYLVSTSQYEKELEKLSSIKKAFVRRYWLPARLEVTLEEEIPVLTIAPTPKAPDIAAITANCDIITMEYLPVDTGKYKTYRILTYDDYTKWNKHEIHSLEILAQRIEDFSGEKLIYLDVRNKNDVYARLESVKIRIGELNTTLKERIERLSSIMPEIENLKRQTDYIDIRWDNTTYLKKRSKNYVEEELFKPVPKNIHAPIKPLQTVSKNPQEKQIQPVKEVSKQGKALPQTTKQTSDTTKQITTQVKQPANLQTKTVKKQTPSTNTNTTNKATTATVKTTQTKPPAPKHVVPKNRIEDVPQIDIKVIEP